MKKYEVYVRYETYGRVIVEASSSDEATELVELGDIEDITVDNDEVYVDIVKEIKE